MTTFLNRESAFPIESLFLSRISYRSFSKEKLSEEERMTLFEAARWAPSSYNGQPWRFIYVCREDKEWEMLFETLVDFNKEWCKEADTLVVVISKQKHDDKPSKTASFDTGAAWMSLALEATARNIIAHAMEGFSYKAVKEKLLIPDEYKVEAMIAIGKPGKKEDLSEELQKMEVPSLRNPLEKIVFRGSFSFT